MHRVRWGHSHARPPVYFIGIMCAEQTGGYMRMTPSPLARFIRMLATNAEMWEMAAPAEAAGVIFPETIAPLCTIFHSRFPTQHNGGGVEMTVPPSARRSRCWARAAFDAGRRASAAILPRPVLAYSRRPHGQSVAAQHLRARPRCRPRPGNVAPCTGIRGVYGTLPYGDAPFAVRAAPGGDFIHAPPCMFPS